MYLCHANGRYNLMCTYIYTCMYILTCQEMLLHVCVHKYVCVHVLFSMQLLWSKDIHDRLTRDELAKSVPEAERLLELHQERKVQKK